MEIFADNGTIPVINGLTDSSSLPDTLGPVYHLELDLLDKSLKFTYVGDCNNVLNSLLIGFVKLGIDITVGCSQKFEPSKEIMEYVYGQAIKSGSSIKLVYDPFDAVSGADIIYTDVWVSMGEKDSEEKTAELFKFQVNKKLLSFAKPDVKIMHCLPAHRESEITSEVIDGKNSVVWQQAENRLHAQKALLVYLYSK